MLLVTGPVTKNMREALWRTYQATPEPKWVVAVGDCAVDGGLFAGSYAVAGGVSAVVPVDLHIRGCPPTPAQLLEGLLALLEASSNDRADAASRLDQLAEMIGAAPTEQLAPHLGSDDRRIALTGIGSYRKPRVMLIASCRIAKSPKISPGVNCFTGATLGPR